MLYHKNPGSSVMVAATIIAFLDFFCLTVTSKTAYCLNHLKPIHHSSQIFLKQYVFWTANYVGGAQNVSKAKPLVIVIKVLW